MTLACLLSLRPLAPRLSSGVWTSWSLERLLALTCCDSVSPRVRGGGVKASGWKSNKKAGTGRRSEVRGSRKAVRG